MPLSNPFGEVIFRATVAVPGDNEATIIPLGTSVATQRPYKYALDGMQLSAGDDVYVIPISGTYVLLGGAVAGGGQGEEGATFIPSVSSAGVISWTNDKGLPNPDPVNIKGPAGPGLPTGGTAGQIPVKQSGTNYDTAWEYPQYCRPNLLENWYFRGGGSQQGTGYFPINQRGQTVYSTEGITIDRWKISAGIRLNLIADAVNVVNTGAEALLITQTLSALYRDLYGKTLTASLLFRDGTLLTGSYALTDALPSSGIIYREFSGNEGTVNRGKLSLGIASTGKLSFLYTLPAGGNYNLIAAKLEIGDYQTLTHTAETAQVLNTIPEWSDELRKCMSYYVNMRCIMQRSSANFLTGNGAFPVPMARTPTVTITSITAITGFTPEASTYALNLNNLSLVGINAAADVFTQNFPYYVRFTAVCE